jgi:hypothetical protein
MTAIEMNIRFDEMVQRIIDKFNEATQIQLAQGLTWYNQAHDMASIWADDHELPTYKVAGIIAALSANKSWSENQRIAELFLTSGTQKHTFVQHSKAVSILNLGSNSETFTKDTEDILSGMKTTRFYRNIANPYKDQSVTVDRHAAKVVGFDPNVDGRLTVRRYEVIERAYKEAAKRIGEYILPMQVQAVAWIVQRGHNN